MAAQEPPDSWQRSSEIRHWSTGGSRPRSFPCDCELVTVTLQAGPQVEAQKPGLWRGELLELLGSGVLVELVLNTDNTVGLSSQPVVRDGHSSGATRLPSAVLFPNSTTMPTQNHRMPKGLPHLATGLLDGSTETPLVFGKASSPHRAQTPSKLGG